MKTFGSARWIWLNKAEERDEYASFKAQVPFEGKRTVLRLVAETNYIAYVNGERVAFGQFPNYITDKYYDEIDLTPYLQFGENELKITVWYEGFHSATHIDDGAGLLFSVTADGEQIACSNAQTLGAKDVSYLNGRQKMITFQLGYTVGMVAGQSLVYKPCKEIVKNGKLFPRPVKKMVAEPFAVAKQIGGGVYDLGRETCGYVKIEVECQEPCTVNVSYGEYLDEGKVPRFIPGGYQNLGRDFSFDFVCQKGVNSFEQFFVRMAGRYLAVESDKKIKIKTLGVLPYSYPVTEKDPPFTLAGLDKNIYDVCVRTLRLCMHEHYEDCPWREQALYVLDSRNQMLCGYYAFKEYDFQRANLVFISKGKRADGFLELTYPAVNTPAIPFFTVMYPVAVGEYIQRTGDISILDETWETIENIFRIFTDRIDEKNLLKNFDEPFWNFYEWSKGSDNEHELDLGAERVERHDLILNCAYLYMAAHYQNMANLRGVTADCGAEKVKTAIKETFYDKKRGFYCLSDVGEKLYSQLGNAFACLVGLGDEKITNALKEDKTLITATLSMQSYVYDALLSVDKDNAYYVLNDIRKNYKEMLDAGATSFWETLEGMAFSKACSLCHGWSAMPIYYYHTLKEYLDK